MGEELTLYQYQVEGISHLVRRRSVLLADEMGLGKTVQAAVAIHQLFSEGAISRVLVVCPYSLCRNWRREIAAWAGDLPVVIYEGSERFGLLTGSAKILVGSYETVSLDLKRPTRNGENYVDIGIDLLVLDEAQRIKDPESMKSLVLSKVLAARRWAITGTPLENHPRELASILRFLYGNEFSDPDSLLDYELILSHRDQAMLRRTKQQVGIQLPPKRVTTSYVSLNPEQASEYRSVCDELVDELRHANSVSVAYNRLLAGLQNLRRIAIISSQGDSGKIDLLEEEIEELAERGEKVVIFSSFPELVLPEVVERLKRHQPLLYSGKMSAEQRERVHQQFLEDPQRLVMCASLRAAGVGLTWVVASQVYHLDPWWNPQAMRQAEDRVHRIGQTKPVLVKQLVTEDTVEEGIFELLARKSEIFDFVIGDSVGAPYTPNAFEALLRLVGLKRGIPELGRV